MNIRLAAWTLIFSLCILSVPMTGRTKDAETRITEVSDMGDFLAAAEAETKENDSGLEKACTQASPKSRREAAEECEKMEESWQTRRLLVIADKPFDSVGAKHVISGYGTMHVLDYESVDEAKHAYALLRNVPGILAEPDLYFEGDAELMEEPAQGELLRDSFQTKERVPKDEAILAAVLDTGYDLNGCQTDRIAQGVDLTASSTVQDVNGHGTAMANIILEHTQECVMVLPIKTADENGRTSALRLYLGIRYAIEHGADVINISMSAYRTTDSEVVQAAICEAKQKGIFVVVSAGNAGQETKDFSPANIEEAIVVSAVDGKEKIAEYSNYGSDIDYCSYGSLTVSGLERKEVKTEGTSVAAALVSAAIAEQKAYDSNRSYEELIGALNRKVKDLGETGKDAYYGMGLLIPGSLRPQEDQTEEKKEGLLNFDWKQRPREEFNRLIGTATNMERRIFLDRLKERERQELLLMDTLFSEEVIYSEHEFDENGKETELLRMKGKLYDLVMQGDLPDEYEIQAKKYHIFAYGSNTGTRSCIKLDTGANDQDAVIYCWMRDKSSDNQNNGTYGITFAAGKSAYDFSESTHRIENCDSADSGNPVVWRLKIRNVKIAKPADTALNYDNTLWNTRNDQMSGTTASGWKAHYWYVYHYQVKPASDAARQNAYGDGRYHGGFWDLKDASGKKCGKTVVTTSVDIGSRDLYTHDKRDGITYRLPLVRHTNTPSVQKITDTFPTCTRQGEFHTETTYTCGGCDRKWVEKGSLQNLQRLEHSFREKTAEDHGIPYGKRWDECSRNCGGTDVNGVYWQRNIRYLQPVRFWEMGTDGSYNTNPSGEDRTDTYYAEKETVPAWSRTPSEEFQTGVLTSFPAPANATYRNVYIPRKRYTVRYNGNGAERGSMLPQTVYCGELFDLRENGFQRTGYQFAGWSRTPDGETEQETSVKNLSLTHGETVLLYAKWKPEVFQITLDNQGANQEPGTMAVYQRYAEGYYKNRALSETFADQKITIPQKVRTDAALENCPRKQKFLGYFTKQNGRGYQVAEPDGHLIADINRLGQYRFFQKDSTVYAQWEDMYAVSFDPNLSDSDLKLIGVNEQGTKIKEPVLCPNTRWKAKGEKITVSCGAAVVKNKGYADIYRFKGWSLTPKISSDQELVLSADRLACTFRDDKDVTLYAQWEKDLAVAYIGNEQTKGRDRLEKIEAVTDTCVFAGNHFAKKLQKPTVDIKTGEKETAEQGVCTETIPCSFQGWSLAKDQKEQKPEEIYEAKGDALPVSTILSAARKRSEERTGEGLTFGVPAADFGTYDAADSSAGADHMDGGVTLTEKTPVINLYAVWDLYPQIHAADLYLPLSDANAGILTQEYLLSFALATDEELKSDANKDGRIKPGEDETQGTSFTIPDYQASEFIGAEQEMSVSITYRAEDAAGNVTEKLITIHLADTSGTSYETGKVRFISSEHIGTLAKNSVWRSGDYAEKLAYVLGNKKSGGEYTKITPLQKAFGIKPVLKPGSGTWDHVQEIWEFSHDQVMEIQQYAEQNGAEDPPGNFLQKFGHCRVF